MSRLTPPLVAGRQGDAQVTPTLHCGVLPAVVGWPSYTNKYIILSESRCWGGGGAYRVLYVTKFDEGTYVLHAFEKRTSKTSRRDLAIGLQRYREVISARSRS